MVPAFLGAVERELGLTEEQAEVLRSVVAGGTLPFMPACEMLGLADENRILATLSAHLGLPLLERQDYPEKPVLLEGVSMAFLRKHAVLPLQVESGFVRVVVNDPLDIGVLNTLESYFGGMEVRVALGRREEICTAIDRLYGAAAREAEALSGQGTLRADGFEDDLEHLRGLAQEAPIVRLVNVLITRALDMRASDIHFEPFEHSFLVRSRVDGVLFDLDQPQKAMQPAIISRLKLMANLNIAERRLPQDGRIQLRFGNRQVDIRVSTVPTIYGESVVLRLLAQESQDYRMEALGMEEGHLARVGEIIERPYGIMLVTGPTGSGKTTTLYTVLKILNNVTRKIITVEDPVEYQLDGINQMQVKPQIGLNFASALRSIVRQDPDVLLIGEVRDRETADIAIESALTGHLVLSTLHTNDAPGAFTRLRDLGIESFLIADSFIAVMAQRLVRILCPHCKAPYPAREADRARLAEVIPDLPVEVILHQSVGCPKCGGTGFRGREGIFEILPVTEAVRSAIVAGKDAGSIAKVGWAEGYRPLLHHGCRKVLSGMTTLSEVLRVTSLQ